MSNVVQLNEEKPPTIVGKKVREILRVIVCDDEWEAASELAEYLSACGHDAVAVDDGALALSMMNSAVGAVCLLSDIKMPGLSGWDLLRAAKQRARRWPTPVLLVTGHVDTENSAFDHSGSVAVVQKPINFAVLDQRLREIARPQQAS